jgi:hypothetical protein
MAIIKGGGTAELEDQRKLSKFSTFRIIIQLGDIEVLLYYRQLRKFFLDIKAK